MALARLGPLQRRGEDGLILVMVAFVLTALIAVAAIVIDLGQAYTAERKVQNAADAAALAGARALDQVKAGTASPSAVDSTTRSVAIANGSEAARVQCTVIGWEGDPLGPCQDLSVVTDHRADGVDVSAGASSPTLFAGAAGMIGGVTPTLTLNRTSAATVQPLVGQDAPLLVCAFGQSDGGAPAPDLLVGSPGAYSINPLAKGRSYLLHAPDVADCGLHSSGWKGASGSDPLTLPGWMDIDTGVRAGPIRSRIAGEVSCGTVLFEGCALVLPICSASNADSGTNGQLYCDVFAAFRLLSDTSNSQIFQLVGRATVTDGQGGAGIPPSDTARVVRLIK